MPNLILPIGLFARKRWSGMFANRVGLQNYWTFLMEFSFFLCYHLNLGRSSLFLLTGLQLLGIFYSWTIDVIVLYTF